MERDFLTEAYLMVLIIVIFFVYDAIFRKIFRAWYAAFEPQNNFPFMLKVRHVIVILGLIGSLFFDFRLLLVVFRGYLVSYPRFPINKTKKAGSTWF